MIARSLGSRNLQGIPLILAHRGASCECPENTLVAFRTALERGADGIECDVQLTKDGELVVIHDERINRTTDGIGWVKDHTFAELRGLDAGGWFAPAFRGERIPTLREVLELVAAQTRVINVELKNNRVAYAGLETRVIAALHQCGILSNTIVSSFNHRSLRLVKAIDPSARLGFLYVATLRSPVRRAVELGAEAIHPPRLAVSSVLVRRAHASKLKVHVWTVNSPKEMNRMISCGVDAVFTDDPAAMRELVRRR